MTEINALIDNYIAVWNEGDPARRRALIAQTWTEDASYVDPMMTGAGLDGIDFGVVAEDGRLRSVTGFLEPVA
jgi:hypothetical protein